MSHEINVHLEMMANFYIILLLAQHYFWKCYFSAKADPFLGLPEQLVNDVLNENEELARQR